VFTSSTSERPIPPKWRDIRHNTINQDKLRKDITSAPSITGIPTEIWQNANQDLKQSMVTIFNQAFHKGLIPEQWKSSAIILLEKDPKFKTDPSKYRPIALLDTMYKIYTATTSFRQSRLEPAKEEALKNSSLPLLL